MKISTKRRYGLSFMLDILTNYHGEPICIKEIACRQGVSDKYLEQIAGTLLRSGLVGSVRGAGTGSLCRDGEQFLSEAGKLCQCHFVGKDSRCSKRSGKQCYFGGYVPLADGMQIGGGIREHTAVLVDYFLRNGYNVY